MNQKLTQEDVSLWFVHGISPVQKVAIDTAKKEYAEGKREPNAIYLRLVNVLGEDWMQAYVNTWRKLMDIN